MNTEKTWTVEKMADYFATAVTDFHFCGDICARCKRTANVAHGAGWFCLCGHYSVLHFTSNRPPFDAPDFGPTSVAIREAFEKAKQLNPAKFAWMSEIPATPALIESAAAKGVLGK